MDLSSSINELELTRRTEGALLDAGIECLRHLTEKSESYLLGVRGIGPSAIAEGGWKLAGKARWAGA